MKRKDFKWDIMRARWKEGIHTNEIVLHDWNGEWFTIEGNEIYN